MKKIIVAVFAILLSGGAFSAAFAAPPVMVVIEPYGSAHSTETKSTETLYFVKVGEPKFRSAMDASGNVDAGYLMLVDLVGIQLANSVEYVQRLDGMWWRVEFTVPAKPERYDTVEKLFEAAQHASSVDFSDLPEMIRRVPDSVRGTVQYVLVFHSGAVAFYFHDAREATVARFAEALIEVFEK